MSEVMVKATLSLVKKGRSGAFVETWTCNIAKQEGWGTDDFKPFAIEEQVADPVAGTRRTRYDFRLESVNTVTNEVFASYEVARSKAWPVERCLMGCGWERGSMRKVEVSQ